jgi:hypothetical protein
MPNVTRNSLYYGLVLWVHYKRNNCMDRVICMELIVTIPEIEWDEDSPFYAKETYISKAKKQVEELTEDIEIKFANIGTAADWPTLLLLINIFLSGKNINEAIDGWIELAKKFKNVFSRLKENCGTTLISRDAARLLCLDNLSKMEEIKNIEEIEGKTINFNQTTGETVSELASKPFNLYVFFFKVNDEKVYVFGIKSSGKIEFSYVFDVANPYVFFE